ncbi:MAG TPA: CPBP family glutamic-type intramembrane protease [Polyangia bacterium]|nr:CPBP family glutamic-type intramembrane protease [Polyangia bacterium]
MALTAAQATPTFRVAALLTWFRLRYLRNALRSRRTRLPVLVVAVSLLSSLAYIGLFCQAFAAMTETTDLRGQAAALALIVGTIVVGGLAAKAAGSDAVLAGSPENEFLLSRPLTLPSLVMARCLSDAVTDPVGALFIFPVLLASALIWNLGWAACLLAALTSLLVQVGVSAAAQAVQISVVRFVPARRRRAAWVGLRLFASLALASLWMTGTWVLRAPGPFAVAVARAAPWLTVSPGGLIVRPLLGLEQSDPLAAVLGLLGVATATAAALLVAMGVARQAGLHGWEQAGASWAEANAQTASPTRPPPTAATKDLRLLLRDRSQLLALVAMPVIFVGVQIFGAAGWSWSTESVQRVSYLSFSLCLYMATIGPLAHMQSERRAFWILLTVPVPLGRLMAAKARAWSAIVGGVAALVFLGLSLGAPPVGAMAFAGTGLLVVGGAVGMTWLAVGLACHAADLSDEHRPAVGPSTIYRFLLMGGLYNLVLAGDAGLRTRGLLLYALSVAAFWSTGIKRAAQCLDPESAHRREPWLGDAATFALCAFLGAHGVAAAVRVGGMAPDRADVVGWMVAAAVLGLLAAIYVARMPRTASGLRVGPALLVAGAAGFFLGAILRHTPAVGGAEIWRQLLAGGVASPELGVATLAVLVLVVLCDELIFRAVIQRALQHQLQNAPLAALLATIVAVLAAAQGAAPVALVSIHALAAAVWALTRRTWPCVVLRLLAIAILATVPAPPL